MGAFWRGVMKVGFWLSFSACIIASIIVGEVLGNSKNGKGTSPGLIIVGGIILTIILHALLGMILEFFDNVAVIRKKVESMNFAAGQGGSFERPKPWVCTYCKTNNSGDTSYCSECSRPRETEQPVRIKKVAAVPAPVPAAAPADEPVPAAPVPSFWVCAYCNKKNIYENNFCNKCGNPKTEKPPADVQTAAFAPEPAPTFWACPNCGSNNGLNCNFCTKCGTHRE